MTQADADDNGSQVKLTSTEEKELATALGGETGRGSRRGRRGPGRDAPVPSASPAWGDRGPKGRRLIIVAH